MDIKLKQKKIDYSFDSSLYFGLFLLPLSLLLITSLFVQDIKYNNVFGITLFCMFLLLSFFHKIKHSWKFPRQSGVNFINILKELIFIYSLLVVIAFVVSSDCCSIEKILKNPFSIISQIPNNQSLRIIFSLIVGNAIYKFLMHLRVIVLRESEFKAQCNES